MLPPQQGNPAAVPEVQHGRFETVPINALVVDPTNARIHSRGQVDAIASSIKAFGFNAPMERFRFAPWGLQGGRAALRSRAFVNQGRPDERQVGKIDVLELRRGDVFTIETPGGGGFGSPFERDPAAVLTDAKLGFVSEKAALSDYGVVVRGGILDVDATAATRSAARGPADKFDLGEERVAWERVFPDATVIALNQSLQEKPLFERTAARQRLVQDRLPGIAPGVSMSALVARDEF
jgi:N-methylhydantoinase B